MTRRSHTKVAPCNIITVQYSLQQDMVGWWWWWWWATGAALLSGGLSVRPPLSDGRYLPGSESLAQTWPPSASRMEKREAIPLPLTDTARLAGGAVLRVAAEEWVPHIAIVDLGGGNFTIRGPMANLLHALAQALNFSYTLVRPPDGAWGIPTTDGDWNGMIGMVKRNEADIALGPFGLTYSRSRVVDFTSPILIDYYRILVRRPRSEPDPIGFLRPFRWPVWVGLVASVGVAGTVMFFSRWFVRHHYLGPGSRKAVLTELMSQWWAAYGALLSQPVGGWSGSRAGWRVAAGAWWVTALVVARSYSSGLTSLLAVRTVPVRYDYLTQVIADEQLHLVFEKATALVEHMSTVQRGVYKELADTRQQERAHFLASSALYKAAYQQVRKGSHALLVEDTTCRKVYSDDFTKYGRCDFYIGKEQYWPLIFSLIGRKGSPLIPVISEILEQMVAHDLYFKWLGDELPNATACLRASTRVTVNEPYSLKGLWGVFVLFAGGLLAAATVLFCEVLTVSMNPATVTAGQSY
ncbi:probable glutamate receptor isoform X2 [Portunus trituberculatus]|uniref:probable glutamate receptor isoform X2 n=2 Tax=Portunus trituberculatus TaxID=210409 RepID=UPI001E1CED88|nr:probable glutamate receptor isoform X2 [Portunus trituberculatus]